MGSEAAEAIRARAVQARRLADSIHSPQAKEELRQMAAALESEARKLEDEAAQGRETH
jgi:hypothetical protein